MQPLIDKVWRHCENAGNRGRTMSLEVKFAEFEIMSRSRSVPSLVGSRDDLAALAASLLEAALPLSTSVRLLGVSLSLLQSDIDDNTATRSAYLSCELLPAGVFDRISSIH